MFARLCGVVGVLILVMSMGWATTAIQFSNRDLAAAADLVVIGNCRATRCPGLSVVGSRLLFSPLSSRVLPFLTDHSGN